HVLPAPDGERVYTSYGVLDKHLKSDNPRLNEQAVSIKLPACRGDYYLQLMPSPGPNLQPAPRTPATVYRLADPNRPLAMVESLEAGLARPKGGGPDGKVRPDGSIHRDDDEFDKRLLLVPEARVLVALPHTNDRVVMYRLALKE